MQLKWQADAGYIPINGTHYSVRQCHWHSPSEHKINGKQFDLEAHMVHDGPNGSIAVIGILYKIGKPDPFLTQVIILLSHPRSGLHVTPVHLHIQGILSANVIMHLALLLSYMCLLCFILFLLR